MTKSAQPDVQGCLSSAKTDRLVNISIPFSPSILPRTGESGLFFALLRIAWA